jgi:MoxR-like ATPase
MATTANEADSVCHQVSTFSDRVRTIRAALHEVVVGQDEVIDQLLVCALTGSHALLVGVPGLAKTLMVKALAAAFRWKYARIQFTPDLMPADVTGYELLGRSEDGHGPTMVFRHGPVFANLVLADEINRAAPKTQSALLEAMAERHVTVGGTTYPLQEPFLVAATQNPIEQEGTYPLPEAQLDRFMMEIRIGYPTP